ncbi:MAG: hypothetical protein HY432_01020 [Candidatus Liptonbacteria bacterium]|nr:hypothetical protein [Candidatus Liptonbacteria bacterium]
MEPTPPNLTLPGNPHYQPKSLQKIFGYDNLYVPVGEVELATLQVLGEIGVIPPETMALLRPPLLTRGITTTQVDEVERTVTHHDIRAWVRLAQGHIPSSLARWIHVPLTSYDPLDTARALQFSRAYDEVLKPHIRDVVTIFAGLTRKFAGELQIGRTHGQHALPITVGFWLATILSRILYNVRMMKNCRNGLVGKISGAVGAYNAQVGLRIADMCGGKHFEARVLEKLGLQPAPISTQILPPEPLAYFLFSCVMLSASLAQFGRDCRHLMRSEIGEIAESFEEGQVGSSTMAHKRNPVNFENLEGMWLRTKNEFGKVLDTLISEHQRDLVGSSVMRDFPIIVVNLTQQLTTLLRKNKQGVPFLSRITVDAKACKRNFDKSAKFILAEPIYIALQMVGYPGDAHELVNRKAVPMAQALDIPLIAAVEKIAEDDHDVGAALSEMPKSFIELFNTPEKYTGSAQEKAIEIARAAEAYLANG